MKQALVYTTPDTDAAAEDATVSALKADGYEVRRRNAAEYAGVIDPCDVVATDDERIAAEAKAQGFAVQGLAGAKAKPSPGKSAGDAK